VRPPPAGEGSVNDLKLFAFDTETTGLRPWGTNAEIFAYSLWDFRLGHECAYVHRLDGRGSRDCRAGPAAELLRLRNLWQSFLDGRICLVMHNAQFDLSFMLKKFNTPPEALRGCHWHDTYILHHILRNDAPTHGLKDLAWVWGKYPRDDEAQVHKHLGGERTFADVPIKIMDRYQKLDAERCAFLYELLWPKVQANPKWLTCYEWERKAAIPTIMMEQRGFLLDVAGTEGIADELREGAKREMDEAARVLGQRLDIGKSGVQRKILYHDLGLPVLSRTDTGLPSVDRETLEALEAQAGQNPKPIFKCLLRYSALKLGASRIASYLNYAGEDGVIHPNIRTLGAVTGREACREPNLQNVEKGRGLKKIVHIPARRCFRVRNGFVHIHVDYAGIELRLLVDYSGEEELIECIASGNDPHLLAGEVFYPPFSKDEIRLYGALVHPSIPPGISGHPKRSEAWTALRDSAKGTNFAAPYGAGADKAAATLGLPPELGRKRFEAYRARWPRLVGLSREVSGWVKRDGGVSTAFGRFLHVPHDKPYVGTNYLIQGTAAEILKRAQVRVLDYLLDTWGGKARMILPIHDEIIFEIPREELGAAKKHFGAIRRLMIDFPEFKVPLEIEAEAATLNWEGKKPFAFDKGKA
jgi:DNA polymerase I